MLCLRFGFPLVVRLKLNFIFPKVECSITCRGLRQKISLDCATRTIPNDQNGNFRFLFFIFGDSNIIEKKRILLLDVKDPLTDSEGHGNNFGTKRVVKTFETRVGNRYNIRELFREFFSFLLKGIRDPCDEY